MNEVILKEEISGEVFYQKAGFQYKLRKAVKEDIENGLLDLFFEGYELHRTNREDKFKLRTKTECKKIVLEMLVKEEVIVALEEDKIIGYAAYKIKDNLKKVLWIDEIIINENYRNKGYGKEIIRFIEKLAKKNKCNLVELSCWSFNKNALEIYEYLGFKKQRVIFEKNI